MGGFTLATGFIWLSSLIIFCGLSKASNSWPTKKALPAKKPSTALSAARVSMKSKS
jgi:hypothetical protein